MENSQYRKYKEAFGDVRGAFNDHSQCVWDILLSFQANNNIKGNLLEIGVQFGKSGIFSALHAADDEISVYCDSWMQDSAVEQIKKARGLNNIFLNMRSSNIDPVRDFPQDSNYRKYRWIHIDGDHSGTGFTTDLILSDQLLSDDGIVVIDDFFSVEYPQITEAYFSYVNNNPFRFHLFLVGGGKGYISRPTAARKYLQFVKDDFYDELCALDLKDIRVMKTTTPDDCNCFGFGPAWGGNIGYQGPDWDRSIIMI